MSHRRNAVRRPGRRAPVWAASDGGATIIEAAVAMVLVAIILIGLAGVMGSGFRSLRNNRLEEQATQVGMQGLEFARSLTYSQVAVNPGVSESDPRITPSTRQIRGSYFGLSGNEKLVEYGVDNPDAMIPYTSTETLDGVTFTSLAYVTQVDAGLRRVIISVTWDPGNGTREILMSTNVSEVSSS